MIDSARLLKDLQKELKALKADLTHQAEDSDVAWSGSLNDEYKRAFAAGRTSQGWTSWRDGEVDQAAVAWLVAAVFVRFCEDNGLLEGAKTSTDVPAPWIAGPTSGPRGNRVERATEHATGYKIDHPASNDRDWWREAFGVLADLPAGRGLVDREHNPVWTADLSAEAAGRLLDFFRATDPDGTLRHDFTDESLDTRFLGDLYQDLSEYAKDTYALLQTPVFIEEFILDRTLEPAAREFGLHGLKLIDPTCGSGHFLLGAFDRLLKRWETSAPGLDPRERVRLALDAIHGVDLNPFAVAIARFRLSVAALRATGEATLTQAPAYEYHLAIGDSLLGAMGQQGELDIFGADEVPDFEYASEDLSHYHRILAHGRYHVVVGNPPYITPKDPAANEAYRKGYPTCYRQYALSVPFMELFFRLAIRGDGVAGAGFVGQITANSFMKQEFGKLLVENLLSGRELTNPVDLTGIWDTSGAHIPGHGTPTVILTGRRRRPQESHVLAALRLRGEPSTPSSGEMGLVWSEIASHWGEVGYRGEFVEIAQLPREIVERHPWQLAQTVAANLMGMMEGGSTRLADVAEVFGYSGQTNADGAFLADARAFRRRGVPDEWTRAFVSGEVVRDYRISEADVALYPYTAAGLRCIDSEPACVRWLWPLRTSTWARATFSKRTYREEGRTWWEWHQIALDREKNQRSLIYPNVATHNHFVFDGDGSLCNPHAPYVKLSIDATDDEYYDLLAVLNSSLACFWLKQVNHNKGNGGIGGGIGDEDWEPRFEFTGTKLEEFPLPSSSPTGRARKLRTLAQRLSAGSVGSILAVAGDGKLLSATLNAARADWEMTRERMIFEQEEMDWDVYRRYGVIDEDLTYAGDAVNRIALGERAFEIVLAQRVERGEEQTAWFERHSSTPITEVPASWPLDYTELIGRRLAAIDANPHLGLLERPEHKRRWWTERWEKLSSAALAAAVLDRLEGPGLWRDGAGPTTRSVAELADLLRGDQRLGELLQLLAGRSDVDVVPALESLVGEESVPYLAALRYKPSGLEKFREWQKVWDLQRREDAGQTGAIPVPPRFVQPDFRKPAYWKARLKLDVPKERFIVYPGVTRSGEPSSVLGWAGWNHGEQGLALARLVGEVAGAGADNSTVTPLLAGLVELEPWIDQWHSDVDPRFGTSPARAVKAFLEQQLDERHLTRDDVTEWTPPAPTRGRPRRESA